MLTGAIIVLSHELGPQARHMALHIATMNVAAPLLAALIVARRAVTDAHPRWLWLAALIQVAALWAAHAPAIQHHAIPVQLATHGTLALSALVFWTLLLALPQQRRWHAIPPLLLTGKLVCLLAVLMVFAPRALFGAAHDHGAALADQQLAGLLMIAACPLSYLVAATVLTAALVRPPVRTA
jgi:putative membrane protein